MTARYWNEAAETRSRQATEALHYARLESQLAYLARHSPFYQAKLAAAGVDPAAVRSLADLSRLPFTEKDELRDSQLALPPFGLHRACPADAVRRVYSTSGTTGRPTYIGLTSHDLGVWKESAHRECIPLLRFRTRDHVVVTHTECPCGRTGFAIRIVGRTDDLLIVRGANVYPSAVREIVASFAPATNGVMEIELHRPPPEGWAPPIHIRIEHTGTADRALLKHELEQRLREKLLFRAEVELVEAGALPRYEYKAKLVRRCYED